MPIPSHEVLPVIHLLDRATAFDQAVLAFTLGADGVFLISHLGDDAHLVNVAQGIKEAFPQRKVGINLLSKSAIDAVDIGQSAGLDMVWTDRPGVTSSEVEVEAQEIAARLKRHPALQFFGSVAFKYQAKEPNPGAAAQAAWSLGMLPTTSGVGTGSAPSVEKIQGMRAVLGPDAPLAIASGMTVDNVTAFVPLVSHFLVSTGVSRSEHHFDEDRLAQFVQRVRQAGASA